MAEPPADFVVTLLREMRREINERFDKVDERFEKVDERFVEQDKKLEAIRQALKAETILGRYAVNDVDDRLDAMENRLSRLDDLEKRVASLEDEADMRRP
jgi:acyl carrier protein phosphodiesterase